MLKFLIADDHPIVRIGLKQILLDDFPDAFIEEASDTDSLIKKVGKDKWSMIITDLIMPGGGAITVLQRIKKLPYHLPVLVVSIYPEEEYGHHIINAGADGFVDKNAAAEELVRAVKQILSGEKYILSEVK